MLSPRSVCFLTEFGDLERSEYGVLFHLGFTCGLAPGQPGSPVACGFPRRLPLAIRGAAGGRGSLALTWRPQEPTHRQGPPLLHGLPCGVSLLHTPQPPCLSLLLPQLAQEHGMGPCPQVHSQKGPGSSRRPPQLCGEMEGQGAVAQREPMPRSQVPVLSPPLPPFCLTQCPYGGGRYRSPQQPRLAPQQFDSPVCRGCSTLRRGRRPLAQLRVKRVIEA